MGYTEYLQGLLKPLGVYDLTPESYSGAELEALGDSFDALHAWIGENLREALPVTAQAEGLQLYRQLLKLPLPEEQTGEAIATLLRQNLTGTSAAGLEAAAAACGLTVEISDGAKQGTITVTFPTLTVRPRNFEPTLQLLATILPCHLAPFYQYLEDYEDTSI